MTTAVEIRIGFARTFFTEFLLFFSKKFDFVQDPNIVN
eukprot:SAG31_NODE_755_length_12319_cov_6.335542_12_plen_38_part_00